MSDRHGHSKIFEEVAGGVQLPSTLDGTVVQPAGHAFAASLVKVQRMVECEGFKPLCLPVKSPARPVESWPFEGFARAQCSNLQ